MFESSMAARWSQLRTVPHQGLPAVAPRCTVPDALVSMERAMARDGIVTNDRQLACARINSQEGQDYLAAMSCAANYAWVNRSSMTFLVRQGWRTKRHHSNAKRCHNPSSIVTLVCRA